MHGVFLEINIHEPGHAKHCSFAITNVCCKVLVFSSAGIAGYRSINCVAVLNWLAFVTVLVLTIIEQYEYSDSLKDQTRLKTVKSGRRPLFVSKNMLIKNYLGCLILDRLLSRYLSRSF